MKNVVIEIDGVRHKLVESKDNSICCTCSLKELCYKVDCSICGSLMINSYYHFELDKNGK